MTKINFFTPSQIVLNKKVLGCGTVAIDDMPIEVKILDYHVCMYVAPQPLYR